MKKIISITILASLLLVAQPVAADPVNLVVNGGFEQPVVTDPAQWDIFPDGTSGLGWTVQWRGDIPTSWGGYPRPDPSLQELHAGVMGWLPQEGNQYAELDTDWYGPGHPQNGEPASVNIYQDLPTGDGCQYDLTFYFSPRPQTPASDNNLEVKWDGGVVDTISRAGSSNTDWSMHNYTVTASGATTRLEFTDLGTANSLGTFLDNVIVEEISCPEEPCCKNIQISVGNDWTKVKNNITAISNTGGNGIANSSNQMGGFEGDISSNNDNNRITTGDATAKAGVMNVVNSNITRNSDCCGPEIQVSAGNDYTKVKNEIFAGAYTGENGIANSSNQMGGFEGDISSNNDGNTITTGDATAYAGAINVVNSNVALNSGGGDCCGPKVQVSAGNDWTKVKNNITAVSDTGANSIAESSNQMGGFSGNISSNNSGNTITTGNAVSAAGVINIVNTNITRSWRR